MTATPLTVEMQNINLETETVPVPEPHTPKRGEKNETTIPWYKGYNFRLPKIIIVDDQKLHKGVRKVVVKKNPRFVMLLISIVALFFSALALYWSLTLYYDCGSDYRVLISLILASFTLALRILDVVFWYLSLKQTLYIFDHLKVTTIVLSICSSTSLLLSGFNNIYMKLLNKLGYDKRK
ncbi:uncharacterized protein NDAI_0F00570 [Naumovozyma dairenensis CBS 421]|uniref:Uncharacterized protein n=1 Tax=Naumovozyma dairenensis (strain ATCC 10597 / BCRC 20456 / CBS 421 / NBRC 0211 / NRRL Y-12639) TaxID=1071378 RepID=G0WC65_NAUDC|nr:hypothetical protein NDAI_0F00570 [Naumovozyma dairenensis CBS 421]CCD25376.1 hypothetical protein NDAI_0F00570 [Naumovozyma dairenensis CBS 421]